PRWKEGRWAWEYNPPATMGDSVTGEDQQCKQKLKRKLSGCWTGPFKILGMGSCTLPRVGKVRKNLMHILIRNMSRQSSKGVSRFTDASLASCQRTYRSPSQVFILGCFQGRHAVVC
ncbi:unnamed protein product, partial [Discosporangium mesarthrocarpum]